MCKKELRQEMLKRRSALSPEEVQLKSRSIMEKLFALEEYQRAITVMFYVSFRNEVDTSSMIAAALASGKTVAVPKILRDEKRLMPCVIKGLEGELVPGVWGILEPRDPVPIDVERIELVAVPGLAFDPSGARLGYGGGYYDRLLPLLKPGTKAVGLAFELQVVDRLPRTERDAAVDMIITESRLIRCSGRSSLSYPQF